MSLPFWTDLMNWLFKKKKKPYVRRNMYYWNNIKEERKRKAEARKQKAEFIKKLEAKPLTQAQIEYLAGQAQAKIYRQNKERKVF